jgi:hypothetical protein
MDVFRVFDSLNWVDNMRVAVEAVRDHTNSICEAAICYTGDILDPKRTKYSLDYYVRMAKELVKMGTHVLAIKDMAGLCRPYAAYKLVKALKDEIGVPIHFHTHDTSGIASASVLRAADAGVDVVDLALAGGAPQHGVHKPGRPGASAPSAHPALGELDRPVDRGVGRDRVGEEQLEQAETQCGPDRGVEGLDAPLRQPLGERVGGPAPLDRAEREALCLGSVAAGQAVALGGGGKRPVRPGVVLEDPSQHLERSAAGRRGSVAPAHETAGARLGAGCPRR